MIIDALAIAVQVNVPTLLWGAPGCGKTSMVHQLAELLDWPCETVIASIREPSDFSGLPVLREHAVDLLPPRWARHLTDAGQGILFLDEIGAAAPATQSALLRVVLERCVGDLQLPAGIRILAATNPVDMSAGGWDLAPPLANRFCHLSWEVESERWIDGMVNGWERQGIIVVPPQWPRQIPQQRALVTSFIKHKPDALLKVPKEETVASRGWPSPRSWDMAISLLAACAATGGEEATTMALLSGCVGEGVAMEFWTWQSALDLPDPEALLENPNAFRVPKRGDKVFTILTSVVAAAAGNLTEDRWLAAWDILAKAAQNGAVDIAALAAKQLALRATPQLPLPTTQIQPFLPVLELAGVLPTMSSH